MDSAERRALLLLLGLAVAGHGARLVLQRPGQAPGAVELLPPDGERSAAGHKDSAIALARPLAPDERIDLDRAAPEEIARLPRVGIALAKRIVADRESRGPFGGLEGLDRVSGVGPGLLKEIEPHVTFSGTPRQSPPAGSAGQTGPVALNSATAAELDALPGIGAARAAAIVQNREQHGPFATLEDLRRVPGISPALVRKLHDLVRVP
jgi:competence ComEA-like helix-hairpin-helix protein